MENLCIQGRPSEFFADLSFVHGSKENAVRAFLSKEVRAMKIFLPRILGITEVFLEYTEGQARKKIFFSFSLIKGNRDVYTASLSSLNVGLYFGVVCVKTIFGIYYGTLRGACLCFSQNKAGDTVQISVSYFPYQMKNPYRGGVIYQVFVDRFARGTRPVPLKEGARLIENWENGIAEFPSFPGAHLENNTFYGGTLYGVVDKLDYIASLGVTLLYLSPIFEAYSNHKYDTADYMSVDSMFGGEKALRLLIKEAEKRGIGIILDGVFNHTGSDSIYFNKKGKYPSLGAYQSMQSPYYSWYEFQSYPDSYTCWWGIPIMPRIHPDRKECRTYFTGKGGVIEKYAKMGIAGFRLDVADELSDSFIEDIKQTLSENQPQSLLYGEVWEDASNKIAYGTRKRYYLGKELDGVMNYPLRTALLRYVREKKTDGLYYVFNEVYKNTPKRILDMQMNLLGTHDTERILTLLGGESAEGHSNEELARMRMSEKERARAIKLLKMLYTVIATLPGLPMVYYGDEVGLEGYKDPFNRMPYPYGKEDMRLLRHYQTIGELRKKQSVYKNGDFQLLHLCESILAFARRTRTNSYITVMNQGITPLHISFEQEAGELLNGQKGTIFSIMPEETRVFRCKKTIEFKIKR